MVLQKNLLFSGTVADNLRWGDPRATQAQLEEACRQACADEFIRRLPEGTIHGSGRGAPTCPGARNSGCALPGPF